VPQVASLVHAVAHAPPVQAKAPQLTLLAVQEPAPLHTLVLTVVELEQLGAPHSPRPRAPLTTSVQVPSLPTTPLSAAAHALQLAAHAVLQQKPSTHRPLAHSCAPVAQVPPEALRAMQRPALQNDVAMQPASLAQVVGQPAVA
jgi:hypothetical protein